MPKLDLYASAYEREALESLLCLDLLETIGNALVESRVGLHKKLELANLSNPK